MGTRPCRPLVTALLPVRRGPSRTILSWWETFRLGGLLGLLGALALGGLIVSYILRPVRATKPAYKLGDG